MVTNIDILIPRTGSLPIHDADAFLTIDTFCSLFKC